MERTKGDAQVRVGGCAAYGAVVATQVIPLPADDRVRVKLELARAQIAKARGDRERSKTQREQLLAPPRRSGCNVAGCGPWSAIATTVVNVPPLIPAPPGNFRGERDVNNDIRPIQYTYYL